MKNPSEKGHIRAVIWNPSVLHHPHLFPCANHWKVDPGRKVSIRKQRCPVSPDLLGGNISGTVGKAGLQLSKNVQHRDNNSEMLRVDKRGKWGSLGISLL